jgi:DNA primase
MIQAGILNTVACMGAGFSSEQPKILMRDLNLRKIVMVLDGDAAGKNGSRRAKRELANFLDIDIVDLPDTEPVTDPSNLQVEEIRSLLNNYLV